jgi:hypothetical protein
MMAFGPSSSASFDTKLIGDAWLAAISAATSAG